MEGGAPRADGGGSDDAGGSLPVPTGCATSGELVGGVTERLIDVFPVAAGIVVVRSDAIQIVGRDRAVLKNVPAPRPITSASFDGTTLVVAAAALITVYSVGLEPSGTVFLTEACAASALMDGGIFVCGPANDWDCIFYTYNVNTRTAVGQSTKNSPTTASPCAASRGPAISSPSPPTCRRPTSTCIR